MAAFLGPVAFSRPFAVAPGTFASQRQRCLAFGVATSLGRDTGRAVTDFVCVLPAGPAVRTAFRRAARRARFRAPVRFAGRRTTEPGAADR